MGRVISLISVCVLSVLFIYTPYLRGLFFDTDFYLIEAILAVLFIVNVVGICIMNPKQTMLSYLIVFLLPFTHLLSLINAETPSGALDNLFRWLAYATMFVMLVWAKQSIDTNKLEVVFSHVFQLTGIWVSFFAVFGLWGWVDYKDIMLEDRLTGTFQYANTFAAVVCAFWLYSLVVLTKKSLSIWSTILFALPMVAYGVGLLHSYSRGSLLVFPFAWFLGLLLLKGKGQFSYLIYSVLSGMASFITFRQITLQSEQGLVNPGLFSFFLSTILMLGLVLLTQLILRKVSFTRFQERKFRRFLLPSVVVVVALLVVLDLANKGMVYQQIPNSLQERISDISAETASLLGRTNVYEDALKISFEAPIIGVGGEGWKILFPLHQNLPYFNNEIHNGFLEILLSTGWLGLVIFILVIAFLVYQIGYRIKSDSLSDEKVLTIATLPALSMLFLHGIIDFDFSYGTVFFVVFWLFAMGVPTSVAFSSEKLSKAVSNKVTIKLTLTVTAILVFVCSVFSFRFFLAEKTMADARGDIPIEEAQSILEKTVALNPYQTDFQLSLASIYATRYRNEGSEEWKTKTVESLRAAEELEPQNAKVLFGVGNVFVTSDDWEKAIQYYESAVKYDTFNVQYIDNIISLESQLAAQFVMLKDREKAGMLANKAISHFEYYLKNFGPFKTMDIPDKRPIETTSSTDFYIGQSYIILGQYQLGIDKLMSVNDPQILVDAQALAVVAYEALGQNEKAATITREMITKQVDFAQKVVGYRGIVAK